MVLVSIDTDPIDTPASPIARRPMGSDFLQANNILILELCNDTSEVVSTILAYAILNVVGRKFNHDQIGLLYSFAISGG